MARSQASKFAVFFFCDGSWCHETDADHRDDAAEAAASLKRDGYRVQARPMRNAPTRWTRATIDAFMGATP